MNLEANKLLVRRYIEEVVNTGNIERVAEFISPDYRETNDPTGQAAGLDAARDHVRGVRTTFPDLIVTVGQQIAEGEWVATQVTGRATHLGLWIDIKPTGKRVHVIGVNLDRVVDGRIVEHGGAANMLEALLAIGAIRGVGDSKEGTT